MRLRAPALLLSTLATVLTACGRPRAGGPGSLPVPPGVGPRVARVESGLLPPVLVEGERGLPLAERMRHYKVPGVAVAVIDGYEVAWARGWGVTAASPGSAPVSGETVFQASSISKPFTAVAVQRLAERGSLKLDQPVNALLGRWKLPGGEQVLLRHLLSHTAGIGVQGFPGFEPGEPMPTTQQELAGEPPSNTRTVRVEQPAGRRMRYSGGGYLVLQALLEERERRPFGALLQELVLDPAGLADSACEQPPSARVRAHAALGHDEEGKPLAGGFRVHPELAVAGLWTSARDLALFARQVMLAASGRGGVLLSRSSAERMLTPQKGTGGRMGLGLFLLRKGSTTYFAHPGGNWGYSAFFVASAATGQGVAVLTNGDGGEPLAQEIVRAVAREYHWPGYLPKEWRLVKQEEPALARLAGRYPVDADEVLTVRRADDHLVLEPVLGAPMALYPVGEGRFVRRDEEATLRFVEKGSGLRLEREEQPALDRVSEAPLTPSERLLAAGEDKDKIVAAIGALRTLDAKGPALAQERLTERGRELLRRGLPRAAEALLALDVALHTGSAAAHDAHAEALLALGDREGARKASEQALEALATDFTPTASWRVVYRKRAMDRLTVR